LSFTDVKLQYELFVFIGSPTAESNSRIHLVDIPSQYEWSLQFYNDYRFKELNISEFHARKKELHRHVSKLYSAFQQQVTRIVNQIFLPDLTAIVHEYRFFS
jgi:hypothetical protein